MPMATTTSKRRTTTMPRLLSYGGGKFTVMACVIWSLVWLGGFLLIAISLPSAAQRHLNRNSNSSSSRSGDGDLGLPEVTIFSATRPFSSDDGGMDLVGARQELAVRSWLALSPNVSVVLFGRHSSIFALAAALGPRVVVESGIDFTFLGTPFFHSMVARSQVSQSGISVLVDSETILLADTFNVLCFAHKLDIDWFLIAMSATIVHFPFHIDESGKQWLQGNGKTVELEKMQELLVQNQDWSKSSERLLMAWNIGDSPLFSGVLPPFLCGRGFHNEWLINEVSSSEFRLVFDATGVISSYYPDKLGKWPSETRSSSSSIHDRMWEYRGNFHHAVMYGSLYFQSNSISSKIAKLAMSSGKYFFTDREKDMPCYERHQREFYYLEPSSGEKQQKSKIWSRFLLSRKNKQSLVCIKHSIQLDIESITSAMKLYNVSFNMSMPLPFPLSLESLLQLIADKDRSVVLAVVGDNYRDMLMSWVCRLRHLNITNFIVCALDSDIFEFSLLQGLPVFRDPLAPRNISFNDCHFGTECFQRVTKVKSRIVLQILKLGYNVLLSDVDVYWFKNPLPLLQSFAPTALVAQSDEYNQTVPINLPRRLNSGFYFARSDIVTIAAMEKVIKHASASGLSEQPSFYDVLCGEGGIYRVGDNRCVEPHTNLTVYFLDRNLFPNGAFKGLWEKHDVRSACMKQGCLVLHNNWISGRKRKLERQLLSGLWEYDPSSRLCIQTWQKTKPRRNF